MTQQQFEQGKFAEQWAEIDYIQKTHGVPLAKAWEIQAKAHKAMNDFDTQFDYGIYDDMYADFIISRGTRPIGNGDMLIEAMEDGYLYDEFKAQQLGVAK